MRGAKKKKTPKVFFPWHIYADVPLQIHNSLQMFWLARQLQ